MWRQPASQEQLEPDISALDRTNPISPRLDGAPFSVLQFPRWNILHKEIRA